MKSLATYICESLEVQINEAFILVKPTAKTAANAAKKYLVDFYYDTQVTARPDKSGKTSEGKFEASFLDLSLKSLPREHDDPAKRLVTYSYKTDTLPTSIIVPAESEASA